MNDELEIEKHMQSNGNQARTCHRRVIGVSLEVKQGPRS